MTNLILKHKSLEEKRTVVINKENITIIRLVPKAKDKKFSLINTNKRNNVINRSIDKTKPKYQIISKQVLDNKGN